MPLALLAFALAQDEAKDEAAKALKQAADLDSYAFTEAFEIRGSAEGEDVDEKSEGRFQKDAGFYVKDGDGESLRVGKAEARKGEDGEWKKAKKPGVGFGLFSVEVQGGEAPRRTRVRERRPPHEALAALADDVKSAKAGEATEKVGDAECVVFTCELKPEKGPGKGRRMVVAFGSGKSGAGEIEETKRERTLKLWVDDAYRVRRFEVAASVEGTWGGDKFETKTARAVEFSRIGETQVEIPDAARKALDAKED